ncbi:hypothetical protein [Actinorugispora endophytica]|uniref:Transmembrane protein n=1 Tax=Actinorugispora endophytica TaxID=1605990 RepID=A0A4R6V186_9ACTN|nr:hypothetical protein [Actinorugispora endophytica]TDQ52428.1 hypothetical protein EV190_10666 [Actinorugispora endophytica]
MKIYADHPLRFCLQFLGDAFALVWIVLWIRAASALHEALNALAAPGALMEEAGDGLTSHMRDAAAAAEDVPLVGEQLARPFSGMGDTGEDLAAAGTGFQEGVAELAVGLSLLTAVLPVVVVLGVWLPSRIRWIRQASGVRRLRGLAPAAGAELLALRALSSASAGALSRVHRDPVGAWRSGDADAIDGLAALELGRLGLKR